MNWINDLLLILLGLSAGSFVNMLEYRTARTYKLKNGKKEVKDKIFSICDFCGRKLRWYENIPLLSWTMLGGISRCCHKKLSQQYPLVEAGTGLLFVIAGRVMGFDLEGIEWQAGLMMFISLIILTFLVFSFVFDFKYQILPDFSTIIVIILAGLLSVLGGKSVVEIMVAAIGASGFMACLYLITRGKGMGFGDVKFAVVMGLLLGWPETVLAMYLAFISGAVIGLLLIILGKARRNSAIAFGPFLIGGLIISWWWGEEIVNIILKVL